MVINYAQGNDTIWDSDVNAMMNALAGFGIVDGCSISKGSGDWDIDVTAGNVFISGTGRVAVSSGTVTISDSSALSSGESRIDLITADTSGTLAAVEGTAATNPDAPDVPSDEVVLGFVVVADTDSTAADSDVIDIPTLIEEPVTDVSVTATKNDNTSGTEQTVEVDAGTVFDAAVLTVSIGGSSADASLAKTQLTITYNDATTQTLEVTEDYDGGGSSTSNFDSASLNEKYITSGIDKIDLDWENEDDANDNTPTHEWYVKFIG